MDIKFVISRIRNKTVSIKMKEEVGMSNQPKYMWTRLGRYYHRREYQQATSI